MDQKELLQQITSADSTELSDIVRAVIARYRVLFPDEEILFLSLPLHNQEERAAILRKAVALSVQYE